MLCIPSLVSQIVSQCKKFSVTGVSVTILFFDSCKATRVQASVIAWGVDSSCAWWTTLTFYSCIFILPWTTSISNMWAQILFNFNLKSSVGNSASYIMLSATLHCIGLGGDTLLCGHLLFMFGLPTYVTALLPRCYRGVGSPICLSAN